MSPQTHEDDITKSISMLMKVGNVFGRTSNNEPCCESRIFVSEPDPCSVRMIIMLRKLRGDSLRDFPNPLCNITEVGAQSSCFSVLCLFGCLPVQTLLAKITKCM